MTSKWRRFEVLLPLQFNDGRDVPADWLAEAVLEIVDRFGAASYETQISKGTGDPAESFIEIRSSGPSSMCQTRRPIASGCAPSSRAGRQSSSNWSSGL